MEMQLEMRNVSEGGGSEDPRVFPGPVAIFKEAWNMYTTRWRTLLGIMLLPAVLSTLFGLLVPKSISDAGSLVLVGAGVFSMVVVQIAAAIALICAVSSSSYLAVQEAYRRAFKRFFSYLWVSILVGVVTFAGFLLLIIPGIIFSIWFSFAVYVLIAEDKRGFEALARSREHVRGRWWGIFGRILFFMIAMLGAVLVFGIVARVFDWAGLSSVGSQIVGVLLPFFLTPLSIAYMYRLYQNTRMLENEM